MNETSYPSEWPAAYREYLSLFNEGKYFEAHEALEALWRKEEGEPERFYQGMIQIAVVFVHLQRSNAYGARQVYGKAITNLKDYGPHYLGINIAETLVDVGKCLQEKRSEYKLKLSPEQ